MPTSPSFHQCIPFSQSSANNSLDCSQSFGKDFDKKSIKRNLRKSHSYSRKLQPILIHTQKCNRRRYTFSAGQDGKIIKKRRRLSSIAWPTRFLLGGNSTDPLNLRSLEDETINEQLNALSPASSPMPVSTRRTQVKVFIPSNINDPLNLNSGEEIGLKLLKSRKRQRHRKIRREDHENQEEVKDESSANELPSLKENSKLQDSSQSLKPENILVDDKDLLVADNTVINTSSASSEILENKISTRDSISKKDETSFQKKVFKRRRSKSRIQRNDTIKFRANAEKFCYGNHITSQSSWTLNEIGNDNDPRVGIFNENLFKDKFVLDIGCNTGILTLLVAKHFQPRRIIGIDIDKRLVRIAQRNLHLANKNFTCRDMPKSMHLLYGPMAKLLLFKRKKLLQFPENVSFLEANYAPPCEEYLETQKPSYHTILCLRVTKWIHLNFGDEGLKLAFKRMFAQLPYGGQLILEPQPWFTYSASKRITPAIYKTYCSLKLKPESFCDYLLSDEVGFTSCEIIGRLTNHAKGYRHNIYLLTKNPRHNLIDNLSPIPFQDDQWIQESTHNYHGEPEYVEITRYKN